MQEKQQDYLDIEIEEILLNQKKFNFVDDILYREVENEAILLHIPTGTYYGLSETSILFWEALQAKQPLQPVVDRIIEEYDVEYSQVVEDLQIFLQDLLKSGIMIDSSDV